jgi:hypothetical protein
MGGHIVASVRRFVLHLPAASAGRDVWQRIARRLGAT